MQKSILDAMDDYGGIVQLNQLLWHLAEINNKIIVESEIYENISRGFIESSYEKSFRRAVNKLIETERLAERKRKLRNVEEFVKFYPYKTSRFEIFLLRRDLLPTIKEYLREIGGHQFRWANSEIFMLEKIRINAPERLKKIIGEWQKVEPQILKILSHDNLSEKDKDLWIGLLIKSREFFGDEEIKYGLSFRHILNQLLVKKDKLTSCEMELLQQIIKLKNLLFRKTTVSHIAMKSKLYMIANFGKRQKPHLKDKIKDYLLKEHPDLISALPGHQDGKRHEFGLWIHTEYSNILDKLIDRHAFSKFIFISKN